LGDDDDWCILIVVATKKVVRSSRKAGSKQEQRKANLQEQRPQTSPDSAKHRTEATVMADFQYSKQVNATTHSDEDGKSIQD